MAYAAPIKALMLRSAMTGNADGMYGAYFTGENRQGKFSRPKTFRKSSSCRKSMNRVRRLKNGTGSPWQRILAILGLWRLSLYDTEECFQKRRRM
jgi:hypothetical protein